MEITTIEIRKLTASEGMYLTNGDIYGKEIYLGVNDSPHNWSEVSEEEYQKQLSETQEELLDG